MGSILITGATGYFGQGFVRKLFEGESFKRICIFSRDEHKQALMRESLNDSRLRFFIGDVRDLDRLKEAMRGIDIVIHAAALKRIEVGHYNPCEMVKTNVLGTMNVIEASAYCGVKKVIGLSTDKAFQPVSAYGQTKALAESLFIAANNTHGSDGPKYSVVRYGNVAGSTGSIIPKWREILKKSDTVPVTDPDCTRFWMTRQDAVDLVLNTMATMKGGELIIPELQGFSIGYLALAMGAKMNIVGLPDWEKHHESMGGWFSNEVRQMSVDDLKISLTDI